MKFGLLTLCLVLVSHFLSGQNHPNLLWEVTGNGLKSTSYLYGSAHLNDQRIFNFDDSVYFALNSSKQFAAEFDMSVIDSLVIHAWNDDPTNKDNEEDKGVNENNDPDLGRSKVFKNMVVTGKPTFMDLYLYRTAMNLGLTSHGLEGLDDTNELQNSMKEMDKEIEVGSKEYEKLIEWYQKRDMSEYDSKLNYSNSLNMIERNLIQEKSFLALAQNNSTFAVVGLAHLIGANSVVDGLLKKGYSVRRVNRGDRTVDLDSIYAKPDLKNWQRAKGQVLDFSLLCANNYKFKTISENRELHYSTEMDKGLIYFTVCVPSYLNKKDDFMTVIEQNLFSDTTNFVIGASIKNDTVSYQNFSSNSSLNSFKGRIWKSKNITAIQMILGFSTESLEHEHVDKYLNGLLFYNKSREKWVNKTDQNGRFSYTFPVDIPFEQKNSLYPSFEDRGEYTTFYKTFTDPIYEEEYFIKYSNLPPGIIYTDPYGSHLGTAKSLAKIYNSTIDSYEFFKKDGNMAFKSVMIDSLQNTFYEMSLIRGSMMYVLVNKSLISDIDETFFDSFHLDTIAYKLDNVFNYPKASFSINAPEKSFFYESESEGRKVDNYSFNVDGSGVTINLSFTEIGKYENLNLHDSLFTYENLVMSDNIDSLLQFEVSKYESVCPGYLVEHAIDSSNLFKREYYVYCNDHIISLDIVAPQELLKTDYVDDIYNSMQLAIDDSSILSMTSRKAAVIINDLSSNDSTIFNEASLQFEVYDEFEASDISMLLELLEKSLLDDNETYNVKYDVVTQLHSFEEEQVENRLFNFFFETNNTSIKERIIESFSMRHTQNSKQKLFKMLDGISPDQHLPDDLFSFLQDSAALFNEYFPLIKNIVDKRVAQDLSLELIVKYMSNDSLYKFTKVDSLWLKGKIHERTDDFIELLKVDTSASVQAYLMDYYEVVPNDSVKANELYRSIINGSALFGKYRVAYNYVVHSNEVPDTLLDELVKSDYYRYWTMIAYYENGYQFPEIYLDQVEVAQVIMVNYIYQNYDYWCESCHKISEIDKKSKGEMVFMKCETDQENKYYLAAIGPFDSDKEFDFDNDQSLYYSEPKDVEELDQLIEDLIEYMKEEEEGVEK